MIDPISVEAMLSEEPQEHFPVEFRYKVEGTDLIRFSIICGCDMRYGFPVGHEDNLQASGFHKLLQTLKSKDSDPKGVVW